MTPWVLEVHDTVTAPGKDPITLSQRFCRPYPRLAAELIQEPLHFRQFLGVETVHRPAQLSLSVL